MSGKYCPHCGSADIIASGIDVIVWECGECHRPVRLRRVWNSLLRRRV